MVELIVRIQPIYDNADNVQRTLIETMIGAALWYIPKSEGAWTGFVSVGVLESFHPDSGNPKPKISEEHVYPRKQAAKQLLKMANLDKEMLRRSYREKYGKLHLITPEENKKVQHEKFYLTEKNDERYRASNISFRKISKADLKNGIV